jgi:hypothetical protein
VTNLELLPAPTMIPAGPPSQCIDTVLPGQKYRLQDPNVGNQWCK